MDNRIGKTVAQRLYVHVSALDGLDSEIVANLREAERITGISHSERYNVVRFEPVTSQVALLRYQDFSEDPFRGLKESWRVDLGTGDVGYRACEDSLNPPIVHRKELLLPEDHPRRMEYAALTQAAEAIGLFDYPTRIGYRRQWEQLVREKGYRIAGHELVPVANDHGGVATTPENERSLRGSRRGEVGQTYGDSIPFANVTRDHCPEPRNASLQSAL